MNSHTGSIEVVPLAGAELRPMAPADLDAVLGVEREIYPFPWTEGNFLDSLSAGYDCQVVTRSGALLGYAVTMLTPDEVHLLNLSVAARFQSQGIGRWLLGQLQARASSKGCSSMLLEVRVSNEGAQKLYRSMGFTPIGLRRRYYPSFNQSREDAIVMRRYFNAG